MEFDVINTVQCVTGSIPNVPNSTGIGGGGGVNPNDPTDPVDPNDPNDPTVVQPPTPLRLTLRPGATTLACNKTVQFKAYVSINGGPDQEIFTSAKFRVSNASRAIIGATSGHLTAIAEGPVTVSVEWNSIFAYSSVNVLSCVEDGGDGCLDVNVGMMVLLDTSRSMSAPFSAIYATKLAFAKVAARQFVSELNVTKDKIGLVVFNEAALVASALTTDIIGVQSQITTALQTQAQTNIGFGLRAAIDHLNADLTLDKRVLVIFTDGENKLGENAVTLANAFTGTGGIVIVVGIRSFGTAYDYLQSMAEGGYFLSAHDETAEDTMNLLSGVKGYFCAGNCVPEGDVTVPYGDLIYTNFDKWNVVSGSVDLIGGTPPYELFNILPGNGLYVDMSGAARGAIQTKITYPCPSGNLMRLSLKVAGNQRCESNDPFVLRYHVTGYPDNYVTVDDWTQPFELVAADFTGTGAAGFITIHMYSVDTDCLPSYGLLIDEVRLENKTTGEVIFFDDFDTENPTYIPPACEGVNSSGCFGTGCLTEPIPPQTPDPLAIQDLEGGTRTLFTSTKTYINYCPGGYQDDPISKTRTATSEISQAHADNEALRLAKVAADHERISRPCAMGSQQLTLGDNTTAVPYPSGYTVVGLVGVIQKVTVEINGLTHGAPFHLDMLLVGPDGTTCMFMSDVGEATGGGSSAVVDVDLVFDDDAGAPIPPTDPFEIATGVYRCSNSGSDSSMPWPAPSIPYGATLSAFIGKNPNGEWKLFIRDDTLTETGVIDSWKVNITTA